MEKIKNWFDGLEDSEQRIVLIAVVFFSLVILIFGLLKPLNDSVEELEMKVASTESSVQKYKNAMPIILANRGKGSANAGRNSSLSSVVTSSSRKYGLKVSRVQEKSADEMQVWMDNVPFNQMVRWIAELETTHQLVVTSVNVRNKERNGLVSSDVKLQRG